MFCDRATKIFFARDNAGSVVWQLIFATLVLLYKIIDKILHITRDLIKTFKYTLKNAKKPLYITYIFVVLFIYLSDCVRHLFATQTRLFVSIFIGSMFILMYFKHYLQISRYLASKTFRKLPNFVLIINNYDTNIDVININRYNIPKIMVLPYKTSYDKNSSTKKLIKNQNCNYMASNTLNSNDFAFTKKEGIPDLVILINRVQRFYLEDPLILYKAEIYHSRSKFTEKMFMNALLHYSECDIRNGK